MYHCYELLMYENFDMACDRQTFNHGQECSLQSCNYRPSVQVRDRCMDHYEKLTVFEIVF